MSGPNPLENALRNRMDKDPQGDMAFYQKVAPYIQTMMDDFMDQIEVRFKELGQSHSEVVVNIYAINRILIEKGIATPEEMKEAIDISAKGFQELIEAEIKKEENKHAATIKI